MGSRMIRTLFVVLGAACVLAGLALNEWTVPRLFDRAPESITPQTFVNLRVLQGLAVLLGLVLLAHRKVGSWLRAAIGSRPVRWLFAPPDRGVLLALLPLVALNAAFWVLGCRVDEVPFASPLAWSAVAYKLVTNALLFLTVVLVLSKVLRTRVVALVLAVIWGVAITSEILIYYFGGMRFEAPLLDLLTVRSAQSFISVGLVVAVAVSLGLSVLTGVLLARRVGRFAWSGVGRVLVWLALLWVVHVPALFFAGGSLFRGAIERNIATSHYSRLLYLQPDSVAHCAAELLPCPAPYSRVESLAAYEDVIERYDLPLGRQEYAPLGQERFQRVVVVFCESLSLPFVSSCNPELPGTLTPFLDSDRIRPHLMIDHRTVAQPTLPGLNATFCSHPSGYMPSQERYPNSFVRILKEQGYRTAFFHSDSRYFGNENILYAQAGYDESFGFEDFEGDPETARYVSMWGVCDRILFRGALNYLKTQGDHPVFVSVQGLDTHPPYGRGDYHGLDYPETPAWVAGQGTAASMLEAVFRLDHDLRLFFDALEREGLYDADTLVVLTADHCAPRSPVLMQVPGLADTAFERIPLAWLSKRELPPVRRGQPTSQLDVAPSLLHLLGLPVPQGYWGRSVFDVSGLPSTFLGMHRQELFMLSPEPPHDPVPIRLETPLERKLGTLLQTYLVEE